MQSPRIVKHETVVLGIDPGLAATGYGVVKRNGRQVKCLDYGCITTASGQPTEKRLQEIHDGIAAVIERWSPEIVVLEEVFMKEAAPSAALSIGQVRGVLLLAAGRHGCQVCGIPPRSVKLALTGSGAADKSQIERGLRRMLGMSEPVKPDHAADALGLAYVGAVRE